MGILSASRTLSIRDILSSLFNMNKRHQKCVNIEPNSQICCILWRAGPACVIKFHSLSAAAIKWSIASKIWRYNNWMNLEFWSLDNVVRFHGFITFIVDTNECKAFKNLPLLNLTWQDSFSSKDLIQFVVQRSFNPILAESFIHYEKIPQLGTTAEEVHLIFDETQNYTKM